MEAATALEPVRRHHSPSDCWRPERHRALSRSWTVPLPVAAQPEPARAGAAAWPDAAAPAG